MPNIGPLELAIVLVIALVIFGPKRLPTMGRQLGAGMREFKDSITGKSRDEDEERPALARATAAESETAGAAVSRDEPSRAPGPPSQG